MHNDHTNMWKAESAEDLGKGYGVQLEKAWFW
jgi:hypothetical protein